VVTAKRRVLLIHGMSASRRTWWRVGPELEARGWVVDTVDLAGHDGRPIGATRSLAALAEDVVAQRPAGSTLVVGHSLGAIVALQLVTAEPTYASGVLLEDPPALGKNRAREVAADDTEREMNHARTDPGGAVDSLLRGHPTWTRRDARSILEGRLLTDPQIAQLSQGEITWDLPALVSACPVPVALVAAVGAYSALFEPDRAAVLRLLPVERVTELPSSHHVHLDEPMRWVDAVDSFGASLL
jgi:pimeloyl-ACP methyl ester carboxylesterase